MAVVLDTSSCLPERRLAVWQDIVCDTFVGLDCKSDMRGAFWGAVSQSRIGPMALTQVNSTAQRVFRTPSRIARASEDYVLMALGNSGVNGVFQDGREADRLRRTIRPLRHHPPLRTALQRQLFANDFPDAAKTAAAARRLVR